MFLLQAMLCICATSISAFPGAFINSFSNQIVPTAPIATQFSPSPLTIVTPPVHDLTLKKVFKFQASVAPINHHLIPAISPNTKTFSVNSFERQQELHSTPEFHQRIAEIHHHEAKFSDPILQSDLVDGVQTIKSAHQSYTFNHEVKSNDAHQHHAYDILPPRIGFKTYGLPAHDHGSQDDSAPIFDYGLPVQDNTPIFDVLPHPEHEHQQPTVISIELPVETKPIEFVPVAVHHPEIHPVHPSINPVNTIVINHPIESSAFPEDIPIFVTNPTLTLPIESSPVVSVPIAQPVFSPAPPLVAHPVHIDADELPILATPAIFAPSISPPPLIRDQEVLALAPPRIDSDDQDLYSNEFSAPDGTKITESGKIFSTADGWKDVIAKRGSYEYISPEGIPIKVKWIADQRGFRVLP